MIIKGIELMQMIADGKIKEGAEIKCTGSYSGIYVFKNKELKHKRSDATIFNRYSLTSFLNTYFEILEDEIDNINKFKVSENKFIKTEIGTWLGRKMDVAFANKINELVRAVNKLNKQEDTSKDINCMTD